VANNKNIFFKFSHIWSNWAILSRLRLLPLDSFEFSCIMEIAFYPAAGHRVLQTLAGSRRQQR
jgi:hypothetical protein